MESDLAAPRSRRALLAAAAAAGGALVASAALPMAALAHDPEDVQKEFPNATAATTSITNSTADIAAFAATAAGTGAGVLGTSTSGNGVAGTSTSGTGVLGQSTSGSGLVGSSSSNSGAVGTSTSSAGVFAWSVSAPGGTIDSTTLSHTGVYGFSPAGDHVTSIGTGVWGDSDDIGVYGSGTWGVNGYGAVGVEGDANSQPGSVGVWAYAPTTAQYALVVQGKASFSRSGRVSMSSGKSSKAVTLAGTTATSKVFAVLATSESGRYVRAVVPASGKFTIYLNTTLTSSAVVSWFVLD
jgi:hypothetical protein